jgi:ABC-type lipoprotein release transport system permease subunit
MVGLAVRYRVNLYREREDRALRFRQGLVRGALIGIVVGVEALMIGVLLVSGIQMQRQTRELERSVTALQNQAAQKPDSADLQELRTLMRARVDRVDWASMLTAVSRCTPAELILTEVRGGTGDRRGQIRGIELEGRLLGSSTDLSPVLRFIETLKADSVLAPVFPYVDLGKARGQGNSFQVVCRPEPGTRP